MASAYLHDEEEFQGIHSLFILIVSFYMCHGAQIRGRALWYIIVNQIIMGAVSLCCIALELNISMRM